MNDTGYDIQNENQKDINDNHTEFMSACGAFDLPDIMDPREWYKIEMQWQLSSCVGNAMTGPFEVSYRNRMGGKIGQFSRIFAYLIAQKYSDMVQPGFNYYGRDAGALIAGARRAAIEVGCCLESVMPYPNPVQYRTGFPDAAMSDAANYKIMSSSVINGQSGQGDAFDEAKTYIGAGVGAIFLGAPWPFNLNSQCQLTNFRSYGSQGHAWCVLGYLKDVLIAANSHDVSYGDKGFFYLTRQGFNELIANRNTTAVGLSDLTVPRGRKVDWSTESMFS